MLRTLLIRPNSNVTLTPVPLGLGYIAGALRKERGDLVEILDARNLRLPDSAIIRKIREFRPDVVGITSISFSRDNAHRLAKSIKAEAPATPVVLGGPYPTAFLERALADPNIDFCVVGEGEETAVDLWNAVEGGGGLESVRGVIFRDGGRPVFTGRRAPSKNVDRLEVAWDLIRPAEYFARPDNSMNMIRKDDRILSIFTSRGCPYGCIFCHDIFGKSFRPRSTESVLGEIEMLVEKYGMRELEILDDVFNLSMPRAKEICEGILRRGLKLTIGLPNGIRGDIVDAELLDLMKRAGFHRISFAPESASPRIQKLMGKNADLDKLEWAIGEAERRRFFTTGFFILGFPTETYEEMKMTGDWAARSKLHVATFFYLKPFPGTRAARAAGRDFLDVYLDDYTRMKVNISAASDEELRRANAYSYRKFYMNPVRMGRILRDAPKNLLTVKNTARMFDKIVQREFSKNRH
jgi:radical SAM superfamily enzyme YgiQ (UPF0313 family)